MYSEFIEKQYLDKAERSQKRAQIFVEIIEETVDSVDELDKGSLDAIFRHTVGKTSFLECRAVLNKIVAEFARAENKDNILKLIADKKYEALKSKAFMFSSYEAFERFLKPLVSANVSQTAIAIMILSWYGYSAKISLKLRKVM